MAQPVQTYGPSFRTTIDPTSKIAYQDYTLDKQCGKGFFGVVWSASYKKKSVAIKFFASVSSEPGLQEREMLTASKGLSNVVQLLGWGTNSATDCFFVAMELHTAIDLRKAHSLQQIQKISRGLFKGLEGLHQKGIIHTDIKPQNYLVNAQGEGVLADLGSALYSDEKKKYPVQTVWYRDPGVFIRAPYDHTIDLWGMGCSLFELALGKPLFPGRTCNYVKNPDYAQELHTLHLIVGLLGYPSKEFLLTGKAYEEFFSEHTFMLEKLPTHYDPMDQGPDFDTLKTSCMDTGNLTIPFVALLGRLVTYGEKISPTDALKSEFIARNSSA